MKSLIVFVTSLLHLTSGQAFRCCAPHLDYQAYVTLYMGVSDLNNNPVNPDAYVGKARRTSLPTQRMEMTEYLDWPIPGFENTRSIITDARQNPAIFYTLYKDGTCTSQRIDNLQITPPCVPNFWGYKDTMQLGSAVWDRYGDDSNKNYVLVERSTCQPVMQLATRKNLPSQGIYRFNTEYYHNVTRYFGTIDIPPPCIGAQSGTTVQRGGGPGVVTRRPDGVVTRQPNAVPGITTRRVGGREPVPVTERFGGPAAQNPGVTERFGQPAPAPGPSGVTRRVQNEANTRQNNNPNNPSTPRYF